MTRPASRAAAALAALALIAPAASAQSFAGTWVNDDPANTSRIELVLTEAADGSITGAISGAGTTVPVAAVVREGTLIGRAEWATGPVVVEGELVDAGLDLLIASPNPDGTPNYEQSTSIAFVRAEHAASPGHRDAGPGADAEVRAETNIDGGPISTSPIARQWAAHLTGKKLTQLESYGGSEGGYSRRRELYLCSTGEFRYSESNSVNVDVGGAFGGGSGGDSGAGQWRVLSQGQLVGIDMRFSDGRHWQVQLEQRDGATYVDGVRTYVTPGAGC